jgi:hypothetical protein
MKLLYLLLFLVLTSLTYSQQFTIKGRVTDKTSASPLAYATIRVIGLNAGTTTNPEGNFELRLQRGIYKFIASFIGYQSDTVLVDLNTNKSVHFTLQQVSVSFAEIKVLPGENPALEIIRQTIKAKHERNRRLNSYEFHAYTKGLIKTTQDFSTRSNKVDLSVGKDTAQLKITGIIENESKGYYKKPNYYKDEIIARKQTANTPASINVFTGGRIIQNFYSDDIQFFGRPIPSPISDEAIDYYDYWIEDTLAMDNRKVFQIHFEPLSKGDPGFVGKIFIADNVFSLIKIDVALNDIANPGKLFNKSEIIQQFTPIEKDMYMPVDYRIFVEGNVLGIAKFGFELNTIFYDYKINPLINDDFFDMSIIKVMPNADKKDSTYWKSTQTIPNSIEELKAYQRIDSLEAIPHTFWDNFSFLASHLNINDNLSITGPLGLYSFNRVEGHTLNFAFKVSREFDKRFNTNIDLSYGFNDKNFKTDFSAKYLLGEYRTHSISLNAYNKLTDLFGESIKYDSFTSTLTSLFGKYDFRDYYYTKGFDFSIQSEVFPVLKLSAGYFNRTDNSAYNNSDFSFFNTGKSYNINKLIYDTKINAVTAGFQLDFRKYIEDGYFRLRVGQRNFNFTVSGAATFSDHNTLGSDIDFQMYKFRLNGFLPEFRSAYANIIINGVYSEGPVPYQMLYALPGNIEGVGLNSTMRTLRTGEVFGDKVITFSIENNFNDEIFRLLGLNFLTKLQLNLSIHLNAALLEISSKSKSILPNGGSATLQSFTEYKHPFYELGFGIGHPLIPFRLEFTWRLNYIADNSFFIGLNTPLL